MSNEFNRRNDDFSNPLQAPPVYEGDPYAERKALGEQKKGCGGCLWGCGCGCLTLLLALIVGGVVVYFQCIKGIPFQVSPETTVITEPLKSDGRHIDFFKAIEESYEPNVVAGENGFRSVLAAYGENMFESKQGPKRAWQFEETCKKLDLDPGLVPTAVFVEPDEFLTIEGKEEPGRDEIAQLVRQLASTPWTFAEQPKMEEWLEKVGPGLDVVQQAAMKEHYFIPMIRRNDRELAFLAVSPNVLACHGLLAQALRIRAMRRLGADREDFEGAWNDLLASMRLARFVFAGLDFSEVNVRLEEHQKEIQAEEIEEALASVFSGDRWSVDALIRFEKRSAEQLDRCIADLESLPDWPDRKRFLQTMQFLILDVVASMGNLKDFAASVAPDGQSTEEGAPMAMLGFNMNILARQLNEKIKEYGEKALDEDDPQKWAALSREDLLREFKSEFDKMGKSVAEHLLTSILTVSGRSELAGALLGQIVPLAEKLFFKVELDDDVQIRVLRAAFALERFRLTQKAYPETLDALELKPLEPELPLSYRRTEHGYVLSCGNLTFERTPDKSTESPDKKQ